MKLSIILILFLIFEFGFSAEKPKAKVDPVKEKEKIDDPSIDFKESRFLQIDRLSVPDELDRIEDQIKQNAVDVVLVSGTHTPIYSQKREDGYSENYKKFYGVQVRISPVAGDKDNFEIHYFYYNWTTNKEDKNLFKKISKYNVLNEVRFGMYELLLGKEYVKKHHDEIDVNNFERIQAVRKSIAEQARIDKKNKKALKKKQEDEEQKAEEKKKKKKLLREDKEKVIKPTKTDQVDSPNDEVDQVPSNTDDQDPEEIDTEKQSSEVKKEKEEKKNRRVKKTKKEEKSEKKTDTPPPAVTVDKKKEDDPLADAEKEIKTKYSSTIKFGGSLFYENNYSVGLLKTYTSLKFIGLNASYSAEQEERKIPLGYSVGFKFGIPVLNQKYKFPMYRNIEANCFYNHVYIPNLKFAVGLDFSPIYFVNVPTFGGNFQVFENDFFWISANVQYLYKIKNRTYETFLKYNYSIVSTSNQTDISFAATKIFLTQGYWMDENKILYFTLFKGNFSNSLEGTTLGFQFDFKYKLN